MLELALSFTLLIASLAALIYFADKLIDHSVKLASILGISGVVIGLTLLAYGTSMPEFSVSTIASFQMHGKLSVSNVIGSNIYNVAVVIGIAALLMPFAFKNGDLRRDGLFMIASTVILVPLAFLGGIASPVGIIMVAALALFTYYVIKKEKKGSEGTKKEKGSVKRELLWCSLLLVGVLVAGSFTVQFAVATAKLVGVSEWLIGSTIVAAGTSMPETVVSIISVRKKQMGMSLGNIIGSNYFNILWILGFSAVLNPLAFSIQEIWVDLIFLLVITMLFYTALHKRSVSRLEGIIYLTVYGFFLLYLVKIVTF